MTITEADIGAFAEFARGQAVQAGEYVTMAQLAAQWDATRERGEVNRAIADSLADVAAGRTEDFFASQDQFRRSRGLPARP